MKNMLFRLKYDANCGVFPPGKTRNRRGLNLCSDLSTFPQKAAQGLAVLDLAVLQERSENKLRVRGVLGLVQWFPTFLMLGPFNTVPHIVVTIPPAVKLFLSLLLNCNFASVMNQDANMCFPMVLGERVKG